MSRLVLFAACLAAVACGRQDGASDAVVRFAGAISDSDYASAWNLLAPESRQWYDSTVTVLHHFGYTEASEAVTRLAGEMTPAEFDSLTGRDLFVRMVSASGEAHRLSTSIRSVQYMDSSLAVVVIRTSEGPQEIPVRRTVEGWRVDLAGLTAPPEEGE